jgi:hypothetical protein
MLAKRRNRDSIGITANDATLPPRLVQIRFIAIFKLPFKFSREYPRCAKAKSPRKGA